MKELEVRVEILKKLKSQVYLLGFKSLYIAKRASPGQLLHLKVDSKVTILRRPFSIHKIKKDKVYLFFKLRGRGTKLLSQYKKGDTLNIIGPLGNGFNRESRMTNHERRIIVAGGMGVAPLVFLAEKLKEMQNAKCKMQNIVLLGARTKEEILCESEFKKMGYKVQVATEDSSQGFKGTVITLLKNLLSTIP
ncbi:MAG: dihydroorotate dehydrogenase electron transfer subunit, partial [Candidatus Omnitrophica bacterium]|nr:dihydroorotate dehydrogenase electron transfer subunit [Candidatus Omnitrophota bacterium]MBU2437391.1 dihydroorotate dehydrogenase electron transfer subunit [Candidatus Omnitrophota bacterium]